MTSELPSIAILGGAGATPRAGLGVAINNAAAVEAMTSLQIFINKQYKCHSGIRITGLEA
jgi:hypothetical protein